MLKQVNEERKTTLGDHDDKIRSRERKATAKYRGRLVSGETTHDLLSQVVKNIESMSMAMYNPS